MLTTEHITRYRKNGKMGLKYDVSKEPITDPIYHDIQPIKGCNYYIKVQYGNKWGVIDCKGKSVLAVNFDEIYSFNENTNCFEVRLDGEDKLVKPEIIEPSPPKRKPYSSTIWNRLRRRRK